MLANAVAKYKQVQATTSSQGELLLALYDGLFRFLNGAKLCLSRGELARARELNSRSYAILSELYIALDPRISPELCAQLQPLYGFCMDRVRAASKCCEVQAIEDVIRVLTPLRDAWKLAVPRAMKEGLRFAPQEGKP